MNATSLIGFAGPIIVVALIVAVVIGAMPLPVAMQIGMMLASLAWLFVLVKIPWDLYFAARRGRVDADESLARGIRVAEKDRADLASLERRLLIAALGVHVLSAAGIRIIGHLSDGAVSPSFAWLFLLSATFRPLHEVYDYLRRRLAELSGRVRHPRDDVLTLVDRVGKMLGRMDALEHAHKALRTDLETRLERTDSFAHQASARQSEDVVKLQQRVAELSHRFESAIASVSSDQELLKGVRAFARMFREQV